MSWGTSQSKNKRESENHLGDLRTSRLALSFLQFPCRKDILIDHLYIANVNPYYYNIAYKEMENIYLVTG